MVKTIASKQCSPEVSDSQAREVKWDEWDAEVTEDSEEEEMAMILLQMMIIITGEMDIRTKAKVEDMETKEASRLVVETTTTNRTNMTSMITTTSSSNMELHHPEDSARTIETMLTSVCLFIKTTFKETTSRTNMMDTIHNKLHLVNKEHPFTLHSCLTQDKT